MTPYGNAVDSERKRGSGQQLGYPHVWRFARVELPCRLELEARLSLENFASGIDWFTPTEILPVSGTPGLLTIGVATCGNFTFLTVGRTIPDGRGGPEFPTVKIFGATCGWI